MAGYSPIRIEVEISAARRGSDGYLVSGEMDEGTKFLARSTWNGRASFGSLAPALIGDGDEDRRQVFGIAAEAPMAITLPLSGQADFSWNGSSPPGFVELTDYEDGVFKATHVEDLMIYDLCLMTTRLTEWGNLSIGGDWFFVDGETELAYPTYPGAP